MRKFLTILALGAALLLPRDARAQETGSGGLGPVCNTEALAEQYVELYNSGNSGPEILARINAGRPQPVCAIVWVFWHEQSVVASRQMRSGLVNIVQAIVVGLGVRQGRMLRLSPPQRLYVIVYVPGISA